MKIEVRILIDVDPQDYETAYGAPLTGNERRSALSLVEQGVDGTVREAYEHHDVISVIGDTRALVVG